MFNQTTMRAIVYSRTGPPEVLHEVRRPIPTVHDGEVRVRIVVSGVNPTDWKVRAGTGSGKELTEEHVPNQDGSGYVDAVGDGVSHVIRGDRVWIWEAAWQRTDGTAQEYVVLPARNVVRLPDNASFDEGASLGIPALTAYRALTSFEHAPEILSPGSLEGKTILVAGGAGAVGHAAIQLAVWAGATVITSVSSPEKYEAAVRAGAHHVVNYRTEDVAAAVANASPAGADIIVEVNPSANLALDIECVATNGTIAVYASNAQSSQEPEEVSVPVRMSMLKNVRFQFILTYGTPMMAKDLAVEGVSRALKAGVLKVGSDHGLPIHRFPLDQTAQAHQLSEHGVFGKVLIDVSTS